EMKHWLKAAAFLASMFGVVTAAFLAAVYFKSEPRWDGGSPRYVPRNPDLYLSDDDFDRKYFPHILDRIEVERKKMRSFAGDGERASAKGDGAEAVRCQIRIDELWVWIRREEESLRRQREEMKTKLQFEHVR